MAIEQIRLGNNEDGTPHYLIRSDNPDAHILFVGPHITGEVTLKDGTTVDVTPLAIEVKDEKQALAVDAAIGASYEAQGHPMHGAGEAGFVHIPTTVASKKG